METLQLIRKKSNKSAIAIQATYPEVMETVRLKSDRLIQPLLLSDVRNESTMYSTLKKDVVELIRDRMKEGKVKDVSVYTRDLRTGAWMSVNPDLKYNPSSILKVIILIAYLKKAEAEPGYLNQRAEYIGKDFKTPEQNIRSGGISDGGKYTYKELLEYMIVNSDNKANMLLNKNVDPEFANRVFTDLGFDAPDKNATNLAMTTSELSRFFRVLFNASYLNKENSEYALELLSKSEFKDGIRAGVPSDVITAHKFGEKSYPGTNVQELHELGIVYNKNAPFLISIMTRGNSIDNQKDIIRDITEITYQWTEKSFQMNN
jgi:beta-lactamase class A